VEAIVKWQRSGQSVIQYSSFRSIPSQKIFFQEIDFVKPVDTSWLRFTITDVYPGAADDEDTLISEIKAG